MKLYDPGDMPISKLVVVVEVVWPNPVLGGDRHPLLACGILASETRLRTVWNRLRLGSYRRNAASIITTFRGLLCLSKAFSAYNCTRISLLCIVMAC